jgi:septal ring factor EnvC (AmiA/AmiB activator)
MNDIWSAIANLSAFIFGAVVGGLLVFAVWARVQARRAKSLHEEILRARVEYDEIGREIDKAEAYFDEITADLDSLPPEEREAVDARVAELRDKLEAARKKYQQAMEDSAALIKRVEAIRSSLRLVEYIGNVNPWRTGAK